MNPLIRNIVEQISRCDVKHLDARAVIRFGNRGYIKHDCNKIVYITPASQCYSVFVLGNSSKVSIYYVDRPLTRPSYHTIGGSAVKATIETFNGSILKIISRRVNRVPQMVALTRANTKIQREGIANCVRLGVLPVDALNTDKWFFDEIAKTEDLYDLKNTEYLDNIIFTATTEK